MRECYVHTISATIIDLMQLTTGEWYISRINTPYLHREEGYASRLLKEVCAEADQEGVTLVLTPVSTGAMSYKALVKWYIRVGFEEIAADDIKVNQYLYSMRRRPHAQKER